MLVLKPSWGLLYVASEWVIRLVMLVYVPQRRTPDAARAWLVFIFLVPWVGLALYALIGRIRYPRRRRQDEERATDWIRAAMIDMNARAALLPPLVESPDDRTTMLAERLGGFGPLDGNQVELLPEYEAAIDRLVSDIEAATAHVHMLFYIFASDATGRRVSSALERAARRGVSCRVLMDAVGSSGGLRRLGPPLREAGVEVVAALPVGPFRRRAARADLRNHQENRGHRRHDWLRRFAEHRESRLRPRVPQRGAPGEGHRAGRDAAPGRAPRGPLRGDRGAPRARRGVSVAPEDRDVGRPGAGERSRLPPREPSRPFSARSSTTRANAW